MDVLNLSSMDIYSMNIDDIRRNLEEVEDILEGEPEENIEKNAIEIRDMLEDELQVRGE